MACRPPRFACPTELLPCLGPCPNLASPLPDYLEPGDPTSWRHECRGWRQEAFTPNDRGYDGRGCPNDHRIGGLTGDDVGDKGCVGGRGRRAKEVPGGMAPRCASCRGGQGGVRDGADRLGGRMGTSPSLQAPICRRLDSLRVGSTARQQPFAFVRRLRRTPPRVFLVCRGGSGGVG